MLLKRGTDHGIKNKLGNTALMCATLMGKDNTVRMLLDGGADIETKDKDQNTILMSAVMDQFSSIIDLLAERGANLEAKNQAGRTAFMVAYMCLSPLFGRLGDKMSRWVLVGIAVILWSLASGASGLDWHVGSTAAYLALLATRCFVGIGEVIQIDTRTGEYLSRAK